MSDYTIETRRRSRSKTPFLRSSCDHENCEHVGDEPHVHHHKKKVTSSPNVNSIVEETVEVTSSSSIASGKHSPSKMSQTKIKTSDYSSEESPESKSKISARALTTSSAATQSHQQQKQIATETRNFPTVTTKDVQVRGGSVATSTPKDKSYVTSFAAQYASKSENSNTRSKNSSKEVQYQAHRYKEQTQNALNAEKELSTSRNKSLSGFLGFSFGENFDATDHLAYLEYKKAGEYWKKTPKTDYTYSELSPHRRELAPGIVAMPNMSRQSLENHHERINYMIQRNPAKEEHIRRRYESPKYYQNRKAEERLIYESGDEVDYSQYQTYCNNRNLYEYKDESWLLRLITTIVTTITTSWSTIAGASNCGNGVGMYTYNSGMYHAKLASEERGFFGSIVYGMKSALLTILRSVYLFISSVLCLDTWLLQSSNADGKNKKRFLLFLLVLLPLMLLAAWWVLDEEDRMIYAQYWHSLAPLSLISALRSSLHNNFHTLKGLLPVLTPSTHTTSQNMDDLKLSLSKSMPPEEYESILMHINNYVRSLVDMKLQEQQQKQAEKTSAVLDTKQVELIVQIIKENLQAFSKQKHFADPPYTLSDNEMNTIIQKVLLRLEDTTQNWAHRLVLLPEHIQEIKKLITQSIEINNHEHYKIIVERLDLDALIGKLLVAPLFTDYLQSEISTRVNENLQDKLSILQETQISDGDQYNLGLEQQKLILDNLNKDIAFVKLTLNDKLSENEDLHYSIKQLQRTQDVLLKRLQELESATDQKFGQFLQDITMQLSNLKDEHFKLLNQQVMLSLIEILGFKDVAKDGVELSEVDLQNWVRSTFVAKEYLELRLAEINNRTNDKIKQHIDKSGVILMRDISERLKQEIIVSVENRQKETGPALSNGENQDALSEQQIRNIVKSVLAIYDADKTGLVDFALESAGGQILSTRCTENYQTKSAQISVFGIPLWYPTNTPRVAISPNVQPGECWAFQGFPGFLVLKLNSLVYVTGFTLEHIPKSLAPNGRIESAPRNFTVWGLEHEKDQEPILFGEYEYTDNEASLQYFPVQNKNVKRPYEIVELRIESNHGNSLYTCLYRFRVHGKPPTA